MKGVVKFYKEDKGYGFIKGEDEVDYFYHISMFAKGLNPERLEPSVPVEFTPSRNSRGPCAKSIVLSPIQAEATYVLPHDFLMFRGNPTHGWEVLEINTWQITAGHRNPDKAREAISERAKQVGANALIHMQCDRQRRSEPSRYGQGTHHYTFHQFTATPANLGRASMEGRATRRDFGGLTARLKLAKRRLLYVRLCYLLALFLVSGGVLGLSANLIGLVAVGAMAFFGLPKIKETTGWIISR